MQYDLNEIHDDHKELMKSVIDDVYGVGYTEQQKFQMFEMYKELKKIPKKDWNSQNTKQRLGQKVKSAKLVL